MTGVTIGATITAWIRANLRRLAGLAGLPHDPSGPPSSRLPAVPWTLVIGAVGVVTYVLAVAGAPPLLRAPFVLGYLLAAPGWSIVRHLPVPDTALRVSLGLALSISIVGLLTLIQAYASSWSPSSVVLLTVLITVAAACLEIALERRKAAI